MIYGLLAALCFGLADFMTAIVSRRIGTVATLVIVQVTGVVLLALLWPLAIPDHVHVSLGAVLVLFGVTGVVGTVAYFGLYRGLELGPVALVAPIVAADTAFAIVLATFFLGERLGGAAWAGTGVAIVGVMLTATDLRDLSVSRVGSRGRGRLGASTMRSRTAPSATGPAAAGTAAPTAPSGVPWAFLSMFVFGIAIVLTGGYARSIGWFLPIFLARAGAVATLAVAMVVTGFRALRRRIAWRNVGLAAAVGLVDIMGFAAFTRGSEVGLVTITTAATAAFPLVPVIGGIVVFGERPAPNQILGAVLVVAGLMTLGLTG